MPLQNVITGCFYEGGRPVAGGPVWGMSLRAAGTMRFRWNEENRNRLGFLRSVAGEGRRAVGVELVHSRTVYAVAEAEELAGRQGDGIITRNRALVPVVTAADCLPVFLYSPRTGLFGALHSGWRGTGIVRSALELAQSAYGAAPESFLAVLAPHIHSCCYTVDRERADRFASAFGADCVCGDGARGYRLSLAAANLHILKTCNIIEENIYISPHCTCCNPVFGSFRREHVERGGEFTVQAAWIKW